MKFVYFNDTGRVVSIHPATITHGCQVDKSTIKPLEERVFILPDGTHPWVKMWDYGGKLGLSILVSPQKDVKDTIMVLEEVQKEFDIKGSKREVDYIEHYVCRDCEIEFGVSKPFLFGQKPTCPCFNEFLDVEKNIE